MDTPPRIRGATVSDRDTIEAMAVRLQEGVAPWRNPIAVRRAVVGWVESSLDQIGADDRGVFVAEAAGSVAGFVTVSHMTHWSGDVDGYIGELVVSPDSEGHGIGTALVEAASVWCGDQGLARVLVQTGAANTRAIALYRSLDFEDEGVSLSRAV